MRFYFLFFALLFAMALSAQSLNSDRPGQGFSPALIPQDALQIQTGAGLFQWRGPKSFDLQDFASSTQLRYGLFDILEVQLHYDTDERVRADYWPQDWESAFNERLALALRLAIVRKPVYQLAFQAYHSVYQSQDDFFFIYSLQNQWTWGPSSLGLNLYLESANYKEPYGFGLVMNYTHAWDRWQAYAEIVPFSPVWEGIDNALANYNLGAAYLWTDAFQIDATFRLGRRFLSVHSEAESYDGEALLYGLELGFTWRILSGKEEPLKTTTN